MKIIIVLVGIVAIAFFAYAVYENQTSGDRYCTKNDAGKVSCYNTRTTKDIKF